jgi:hypothetical protein
MEARSAFSMELTIGSKLLTTMFFVIEVQGNYCVIIGHNWIHSNHCFPSTLHQFFIQWIDDEIKVVHVNAPAYIALADWQHGSAQCMSGKALASYDFLSITKDGFVPVSVQPAFETQLGDVIF